jgi:hypothetical protein
VSESTANVTADAMRARCRSAKLFWLFGAIWFLVVLTTLLVEAHQFGGGTGIGDGRFYDGGQALVGGRLDGHRAVVPNTSFWGDSWRLAVTAALGLGLIGFWYVVAKGFGSPTTISDEQAAAEARAALAEPRPEPYRRIFVGVSIAGISVLSLAGFVLPYVVIRYGWGSPL